MKARYLIILFFAILITSCGDKSSSLLDLVKQANYFPIQEEEGKKWGLLGKDGEILLSEEYKNQPSLVINGLFSVPNDRGLYTVYQASKKPKEIIEDLIEVGYLVDGVLPIVRKNERISVVDKEGKTIFTLEPQGGKEIISSLPLFSEGVLIAIDEDGNCGAFNTKGEKVIDFKYKDLGPFLSGVALAKKEISDNKTKTIVLDTKGKEVENINIKEGYEIIGVGFIRGYLPVKDKEGSFRFITKKGDEIKLPGKVQGIGDMDGKYFVFKGEDGWGVMTIKEDPEIIIKAKYSGISILEDNKFLAIDNKDTYVLNNKGDKILEFNDEYHTINSIFDAKFKFIAQEKSHYVLLDDQGKPFNKMEFASIITELRTELLNSNYFDVVGMVQNLTMNVTDKGIGQYFIGEKSSELGLNPDDYRNSLFFKNDNLDIKGYKYEISFLGSTNNYISINEYDFSLNKPVYIINPESKVESLQLTSICQQKCWDKAKPLIIEALKTKGFKIEKEMDYAIILTNSNCAVYVTGGELAIIISMSPNTPENIQKLTDLMNIAQGSNVSNNSNIDDEYYPDPDIMDW